MAPLTDTLRDGIGHAAGRIGADQRLFFPVVVVGTGSTKPTTFGASGGAGWQSRPAGGAGWQRRGRGRHL